MKQLIIAIIIIGAVVGIFIFRQPDIPVDNGEPVVTATPSPTATSSAPVDPVKVVAQNLQIPWDVAFRPGNILLVTERVGRLAHIDMNTGTKNIIPISSVKVGGEGGLLGLVLHPKFDENHYIYLYIGTPAGNGTQNRVVRYEFVDGELFNEKVIISGIPGALYHDGGRMEFGPDGYLYITTGDATNEDIAQNKASLGGKILRLNDDGSIPSDNPFGTAVYSYGHRNPQGLAWDDQGRLWQTEHGRSGVQSGMDEVNLIIKGGNYGWPTIEGDETQAGMIRPALHSGASDTWAPASALFYKGAIYFGGLRGEALFKATLNGDKVAKLDKYFHKQFGRIRTVRLGPDGMFYITTSNTDNRGSIKDGDDKIIRIDPAQLK